MRTRTDPSRAGWRKSSRSTNGGVCVEVAAWRKSSRSTNGGQCVEATLAGAAIAVRDSKNANGPRLTVGPEPWNAFTACIKTGSLDRP